RDVQIYTVCDELTEPLIYLMVVFTPWAFGTTQPWSIWTMNAAGYGLGGLLAVKLFLRRVKGYFPPAWNNEESAPGTAATGAKCLTAARLTNALALITLLILAYCLISAINARATYRGDAFKFDYHDCIS